MANETPSRPTPPFMANAILNFHFDYLNPSLSCLALISFRLLQVKSISLSISKCIIQTSWKVLSGLFHLDHCQNFNRPTKIHSINGNIFRI